MSGHSKWSQIKRQKGAADVKRGTLYTKLSQVISSAAAECGNDPAKNMKLRFAIDKARSENMPKETIERAIQRGSGATNDQQVESVMYEAFGPSGIAIIIEAATDNKNRTAAEVRQVLAEHGGTLGGPGSVQWRFVRNGTVLTPKTPSGEPNQEARALLDGINELSDVVNVAFSTS